MAATRFPPEGCAASRVPRAPRITAGPKGYFARAQAELCVIVQIETKAALDRIEDIASVPGVDAVFIGPSDLSASMGHLGDQNHPDVQAAIDDGVRA